MNRNLQSALIWALFIGLMIWIGWTGDIFESRIANLAYEAGFLLAAAVIIIFAIAALNTFRPSRSGLLRWIVIAALIAGAALAKGKLDDSFARAATATGAATAFTTAGTAT